MEKVNPLEEVVCLSEAAALVGYTEGSLRNWIKVNRIKVGEYKKSGRITLVLKSAVMREAGRGNN